MSFYAAHIQKTNREHYPKAHLTTQLIQAKRFMDTQFADNISVENFAREAFLSKFHFIRLFKIRYGCTPHQHLISVRMQAARKMLKTNKSIAEVCTCCGFESIPSFTTLFKKRTGVTPARFQKSNIR